MKKIAILVLFSFFYISCTKTEHPINIKFSASDENVTLFYSGKTKTIWAIGLPFDMAIENPSSEKLSLAHYSFYYGSVRAERGMKLYLKEEGQLIKQSLSKAKDIDGKKTNSYVVRPRYSVDSTKFAKNFFKPYIETLKDLKQDTLNIGSISEVKAEHKGLIENLVQNDSIYFLFIDENSSSNFRRERRLVEY